MAQLYEWVSVVVEEIRKTETSMAQLYEWVRIEVIVSCEGFSRKRYEWVKVELETVV